MALANLLSGASNAGTGATVTFTYTNSAACVIVAEIETQGGAGFVPITGVTDGTAITWHRRSSVQFISSNFSGLSASVKFVTHEVWWANVTATNGSPVTVTIAKASTATNEVSNTLVSWATFTGSLVPTTPWDVNASLGQVATYSNASTPTLPTKAWTVTSSAAFLLGFMHQMGATGGTAVSTAPTGSSLNSSHVTIGNSTTGPVQSALSASTAGVSGSGTQTWNGTGTLEWTLFVDALTSDSTGTAAEVLPTGLAIHGTPVETFDQTGTATSIAATITTTSPAVIIAVVNAYNFAPAGAIRTVTGISGGGLTWTKRGATAGQNSGPSFSINQEIWWANATGPLTAQAITATMSGAVSQNLDMIVFAVTGSPSPSSPWDANGSLPAHTSHMTGVGASMTVTGTTTATKSMLLAFNAYGWNSHAQSTIPASYSDVLSPHTGTSLNIYWDYQDVTSSGSKTATYGTNQDFYQITLDALTGDVSASLTGTIATSLTKVSQSIAAKETFPGTITTHLTKASQSVAAKTTVTGTITTHLTKASLSVAAAMEAFGTITTSLTKPSQSAAAKETFTGTIATHLTKASIVGTNASQAFTGTIATHLTKPSLAVVAAMEAFGTITTALTKASLSASAAEIFTGAAVTHLSGISQQLTRSAVSGAATTSLSAIRQTIAASEIVIGTAVTHINNGGVAIAIEADTFEIFFGTIVTRLTKANFAVAAEERFAGQITTRLGSTSGAVVANVIEALEIIEGPIVTTLPPFRPLVLGIQLGSPGQAKWFSWRYTDA